MSETIALEARNIFKWFPGGFANDMVDFELRQGEIHALLGENGAGKTTLMNIINGLYTPDGGEIYVHGREAEISQPKDALALGIGMLHQEFMLIPVFTVLENIVLGQEDRRGLLLDLSRARQRVTELSQQYGFGIDPEARLGDLPVGMQQRVELLKALYRQARILILDEPTGVLTPQEVDELFGVMQRLSESGISIIFVTHKLQEVMHIADRITVMRRGKVVATITPAETSEQELAESMVGRPRLFDVPKAKHPPGAPVLEVSRLSVAGDRGLQVVKDATLGVRAGEILGLAGVQGNGQSELLETLAGLRSANAGKVTIAGETLALHTSNPRDLEERGVAYIPAAWQERGLVLPFSVAENLALKSYFMAPFTRGVALQGTAFDSNAAYLMSTYGIKAEDVHSQVATLSIENQQKVVFAREISRPVKLLLADQPTRGLSEASAELVHRYLVEKRDSGCAILLASSDLDEILSLSDRIAVMYRGGIVGHLPAAEASKGLVGMMMAGIAGQ